MDNFLNRDELFDGVEGESLWHRPIIILNKEPRTKELSTYTKGVNDHRVLALLTALLVENRVEHILSEMLPKYKILQNNTYFTFSLKLRLLESFNIIPAQIIKSADIIRKIRNDFAHDIQYHKLADLNQKLLRKLITYQEYVYKGRRSGEEKEDVKNDYFESFKLLSFYCINALDAYIENAEEFSKRTYHNDYFATWSYNAHDIVNEGIMKAFQNTPIDDHVIIGGINNAEILFIRTKDNEGFLFYLTSRRLFDKALDVDFCGTFSKLRLGGHIIIDDTLLFKTKGGECSICKIKLKRPFKIGD